MIPKTIHSIWWQSWNNLPSKYDDNIKSIIDKNPDYKFIKWDEKSIREVMKSVGPEYLAKLDDFKLLHQKIDMARYFLLWNFGGISCDVDIFSYKSFNDTPFIKEKNFIVSFNSSNAFENWIKSGKSVLLNNSTILVSQNNPIMKGLLDHIMGLSCDINQSKESCVNSTTGPNEFTKYLEQYKDQITILDNEYFEPCQGNDDACEINTDVSILDHKHESSWISPFYKNLSKSYYFVKRRWMWILLILVIIILILSGRRK